MSQNKRFLESKKLIEDGEAVKILWDEYLRSCEFFKTHGGIIGPPKPVRAKFIKHPKKK